MKGFITYQNLSVEASFVLADIQNIIIMMRVNLSGSVLLVGLVSWKSTGLTANRPVS